MGFCFLGVSDLSFPELKVKSHAEVEIFSVHDNGIFFLPAKKVAIHVDASVDVLFDKPVQLFNFAFNVSEYAMGLILKELKIGNVFLSATDHILRIGLFVGHKRLAVFSKRATLSRVIISNSTFIVSAIAWTV